MPIDPILYQNEYVLALYYIIGAIVLAKVLIVVLKKYLGKLTAKTKTDIDDIILQNATKPLYILIIVAGIYAGLSSLSIVTAYPAIPKIIFALVVLIIALLVSRTLAVLISHVLKVQKKFEKTPKLINKVVGVVIYLLALVIILDHFGVAISPILATLGVGGLAVGLALQPTLADLFAGIHIISDQPIRVGDFIELDAETKGTVEDIGWRSTRIRTPGNNIIIVPNSKLADTTITNSNMPQKEVSCLIYCGVGYGENLEKVEKIVLDVAKNVIKKVDGAVKDYQPKVRFYEFGDSNINFKTIFHAKKRGDKFLLTHEFIKALKKEFDKRKIDISFPVRKIVK